MGDVTLESYRAFDVAVTRLLRKAREEEGHTIPCAPGCDACCSSAALATPFEIPVVIEAVRAMPPGERAALHTRLQAWARALRNAGVDVMDDEPPIRLYEGARATCPFLQDHRCSIYAVRPLACRGHYVIDAPASVCADRVRHPTVQVLILNEPLLTIVAHLQQAFGTEKIRVVLFQTLVLLAWELVEQDAPGYEAWVERTLGTGTRLTAKEMKAARRYAARLGTLPVGGPR
jgi:Fe-S-cluster containining protein